MKYRFFYRLLVTLSFSLLSYTVFAADQSCAPMDLTCLAASKNRVDGMAPATPVITSPKEVVQSPLPEKNLVDRVIKLPVAESKPENTEFQLFVQESIGKILPLYGYSMFNEAPSTFSPVDHVPVTQNYVIGPGDEVIIHAWGQLDADFRAKVDRLGAIYIPKVGNVHVAGLKYQDLQDQIKIAVGRVFRNFELEVNLGQLRSIQIYVVGQARLPGSYTVSSLSTLVNALFASGGPSVKGSMRKIQLKRNDKVITEFDIYDFLLKGDKSKDVPLQSGDVVYIPPVGSVAAITGSINVPAIYELKDKTDLSELITLSGGLATTADGKKVEVERIDDRKKRTVDDFLLDNDGLKRPLKDGDLVKVLSISPKFENAVTLRGNVAFPFRAPWHEGMRVKDLIPEKDVLLTKDYWLKKNQSDRNGVAGLNSVFNEIKASSDEINWDYAAIERINFKDLTSSLIPLNLGKAVLDNDPGQNLLLMPGDVVTVFSKSDMRVPAEKQVHYIRIEGEAKNAGIYAAKPGETFRQLLIRVGGITENAYLFGIEFTRESTRVLQKKKLDETIGRLERDLDKSSGALAAGAMGQNSADAVKIQLESQKAMLAKMRQFSPTGRIVLEIAPNASSVKDVPDISLEDGDRFYIPPAPSTVGVFGEVYNENNAFIYKQEKRLSDYLAQAGGPTREADSSRIFLLRADGSVISSQSDKGLFSDGFESMHLMPGDTVVVPEKTDKVPLIKNVMDWTQILMNMGVGLASLRVIGVI